MLLGDAAVRGYGSGGGWEYDGGICYGGREGISTGGDTILFKHYSIWYELIYLFLPYHITINWQGIKIGTRNTNTH